MTRQVCKIDGCGLQSVSLVLCEKHYRRFKKYGDPLMTVRLPPKTFLTCTAAGCDLPHLCSGFCNKHYTRWRKYGDPLKCAFEPVADGEPFRWVNEIAIQHTSDECLIWPFAQASGYGQIWVDGKKFNANRLICEIVSGPPPSQDHVAAHLCGVSLCSNPQHLKWKTYSENEADKLIHGTHLRGERNPCAKLSEEEVMAIRSADGTHQGIADQFGVSRRLVGMIKNRKIWSWL
jgi:hypothetical protein